MHGGEEDDATNPTMEPSPEPNLYQTESPVSEPNKESPAPVSEQHEVPELIVADDIAVEQPQDNLNDGNIDQQVSENVVNDAKSGDITADTQLTSYDVINTQKRYDLSDAMPAKRRKEGILKDHLNANNNQRSVRFRDTIASFVEPVKVQNIDGKSH